MVSSCSYPGGTADAQISAAFAALPGSGGIVDDRCHSGTQTWRASPFASIQRAHKAVTLLLGAGTIMLGAPVTICTSCKIQGISRNATLFRVAKDFPANSAAFTMGDISPSYDVWISQLGISTEGRPGVTAIYNAISEEKSTVSDVSIYGLNGGVGVDIETPGAQNSGPYENLEILVGTGAPPSTTGIRNRGATTRAIRGITVNAAGANGPIAHGIELGAGGRSSIEDYHCESTVDCVFLDGTAGVVVNGVYGSDNPNTSVANAVHITPNNAFVTLMDINKGGRAGSNILDDLNGVNERGAAGLGWYATGFTSGGMSQSLFSSSADVFNYTRSWKLFPTGTLPACAAPGDVGKTALLTRGGESAFGYCTATNASGFNFLWTQMDGEYDQPSQNGTVALDTSRGSLQYVTLAGNSTGTIHAGILGGERVTVQICNGAQNYSWSWPSNIRGGGSVDTGANRCQSQSFTWNAALRVWIPMSPITAPY